METIEVGDKITIISKNRVFVCVVECIRERGVQLVAEQVLVIEKDGSLGYDQTNPPYTSRRPPHLEAPGG